MIPCLPADDLDSRTRARTLERARERYRWCYESPPGIPLAAEVPYADGYSLGFLSRVLELHVSCATNHAASRLAELFDDDDDGDGDDRQDDSLLERLTGSTAGELFSRVFRPRAVHERVSARRFALEDYVELYATIPPPPLVEQWRSSWRRRDLVFAWQRLAGANPTVLRRVSRLPDNFPVTPAIYRAAVEGDTLEAARAEGRLFLADYRELAHIPHGRSPAGAAKYVYAPLALFSWQPSDVAGRGAFVPVAIQCAQRPSREHPIWTPRDGWRWRMAQTVVQNADGIHHQLVAHLARTHLLIEPFVIAAHRQLSTRHPIHHLLAPHFEFTLAINDTAASNLVAEGGEVELVLGGTLEGSLALAKSALASFHLEDALPDADLRARGLDDRDGLPTMPFRDDGMPVWRALRDWVEGYLRLYYHADVEVARDRELQAWLREIAAEDGGRLPGVGTACTITQVVNVVAFAAWTASAQHSAVNFSQFDFMSFIPNMPGALYARAPGPRTPDRASAWQAMLPPLDDAALQCDTVYQLSSVRKNGLTEYPAGHFENPAARPLLRELSRRLAALDEEHSSRDRTRLLPYPYLRPSNIARSIHI